MKTLFNKINIKKFIILFLLIQPIVDLFTSLSAKFNDSFLTIGVFIKGLFLLTLILFSAFKYKFKDRKISTIFLMCFCAYEFLYLLICYYNKGALALMGDFKNSIKAFFAPITLLVLYDVFKNEKINIKSRYFAYILVEYSILILLANFSGFSFNTYFGGKIGEVGWFFSGNDIGTILILLFPILYFYTIKSNSKILVFILFVIIYTLFQLGTKTSVFGIILVILFLLILAVINYNVIKNDDKLKKNIVLLFILGVFVALLIPNSAFLYNIKMQYNNYINNINLSNKSSNQVNQEVLDELLFSGRNKFKIEAQKRYNKSTILQRVFGLGYYDGNNDEYKLVERDHYDLFFNHGVLGFLIYIWAFGFILFKILNLIIKNGISNVFKMNIEVYILAMLVALIVSNYSGHVFLTPTVSLYSTVICIVLYFKIFNLFNFKKEFKNKKITILSLHLKYGGIEKFISTTSKFLSENYDVEIVSVYKYPENEIVKIDKNINVKYLLKDGQLPNKEKLQLYLKEKKVIMLLKELIYALKILILKKIKMINYVKNCDSDVIISTRIEHNRIISEYASDKSIKIATEHNYHSKKYSKKVLYSCSDVDYFVVSTLDQKKYYKKLFEGNKLVVVKIPFALENISKASSKLNNYNLVSIGRLSIEKGYTDLIDIFNLIFKNNSKYSLTIVGEGIERKKIEEKIKEYNLEKNVKLVGAKNSKEIQEILMNSSFFLMTSHTESFGIVIIEAMSCGVPCIIFDSAKGALELVKDGYNGYVIEDRDIHKYAKKILKIFEDKKKLSNLGVNSKNFANNFTVEKVKKEWLQLLK